MVDYDWWLARGKATKTTLEQQVDVMSRISVLTGGRVHGFAPYCPFREVMTTGTDGLGASMRLVKRAVESQGFIGVKLYPPMGFAAWGNEGLNVWHDKRTLPSAAREPGFGKRLDGAMKRLFDWCRAEDVPIMAHANRSNGPHEAFKDLAGSDYWAQALTRFPGLKVSFGHFGDTNVEDHEGELSSAFVKLMSRTPGSPGERAFADSGYFAGVLANPSAMVEALLKLNASSDHGVLAARLMYGTDWTMILPERDVEKYLAEFIGVMSTLDAPNGQPAASGGVWSDGFFGGNAVNYLGLRRGDASRKRLEGFYERRKLAEPDWMRKVG